MKATERTIFIGSKKLGLNILKKMHKLEPNSLVGAVTLNDSKDTRSGLDEFRTYCLENDILLNIAKNKKTFNQIIHDLKPDRCIVVNWYWLIEKEILDSVKYGFIGIHHSSLPTYRGGSPLVWQIINGESIIGSSIFTFTEGMDSGPIWDKVFVNVTDEDCVKTILEKLETKILEWFNKNYLRILNHEISPQPQLKQGRSYCAQRFPFDGKIDWNKTARDIHTFIRAQSHPYPGAFTHYRKKKLIIWKAKPLDMIYHGTPGQVARVTKEGVYVICGDSKPIVLETVQLDGAPMKPAHKVLKSFKVRLC